MKPVTQSQDFFRGALILTVAALVSKILSAIYRVPFQNIVGDVGFYIYQQVYPFYGAMLVLSTYGFPVIISKLYTEQMVKGNKERAARLLLISLSFLCVLGLILFSVFYFGADWIASMMGDKNLTHLFRIVAIPFLIFPFVSVLRGYFQGKGNMVPTAFSQVGEQLARVLTILLLSFLFVHSGYSLYTAGSGAVFGSVTGGIVCFTVLGFFYLRTKERTFDIRYDTVQLARESLPVIKDLSLQGFAISISGMVLVLMQLADSLNLYNQLISLGITEEEAKKAKGIFDRGQPLIQLGTVVATSFALSLVPAISGEKLRKRKGQVLQNVRIALQMSLLVGAAASVGLYSIIEPTNAMLYKNTDGSYVLALLSFIILPGSIMITVIGVLQGLNQSMFPAFIVLAGFMVKYSLNLILIPLNGTSGAAMATIITMSIMTGVLIARLRTVMKGRILPASYIVKILLASGTMGVFLHVYLELTGFFYLQLAPLRLVAALQAVSAVIFGAVLYLIIVIKIRVLKETELLMLPFGSKLLFLLPKKTGDDQR